MGPRRFDLRVLLSAPTISFDGYTSNHDTKPLDSGDAPFFSLADEAPTMTASWAALFERAEAYDIDRVEIRATADDLSTEEEGDDG